MEVSVAKKCLNITIQFEDKVFCSRCNIKPTFILTYNAHRVSLELQTRESEV